MADKSKDTGTGGINIDGELYSMDVVVPNSPEDAAGGKQGEYSPGDIAVDNTVKDISKPTKETFAKYLSKEIRGINNVPGSLPNKYGPFEAGSGNVVDFSLNDSKGYPASPTAAQSVTSLNAANRYADGPQVPSSYSSDATETTLKIKRGKQDSNNPDGNSLLKDATFPATPGGDYVKPAVLKDPINTYVSAVLQKNRFTAGSSFLNEDYLLSGPDAPTLNTNASFAKPSQLKKGASAGNNDVLEREYGLNRLAQIGTVLQLRSAVEAGSTKVNYNPDDAARIKALLPGIGQVGVDVKNPLATLPYEYIDIKNIIDDLTTEEVPSAQLVNFNSQFEGTVNHVFEKFSGFSSAGMIVLSTTLVAAIIVAFEIIGGLVNLPSIGSPVGHPGVKRVDNVGRPLLGSFNGEVPIPVGTNILDTLIATFSGGGGVTASAYRLFGINATSNYPFFTAVDIGLKAYFGLNQAFLPTKLYGFPGHAVITARAIIRSTTMIILAFKELSDTFNAGNTFAGVDQALNILNTIRSSRVIAALNVFSQIGDTQLTNPVNGSFTIDPNKSYLYDVTGDISDAGRKISEIDAADDNDPAYKYSKSRLFASQGTVRKLAWATNRVRSSLLIPKMKLGNAQSFGSALDLASNDLITDDPYKKTRYQYLSQDNRISDADKDNLERALESEYVPFYFHDVRTNEVVAFHAFLTSLSDDYNAEYESTTGFGRVEPVKSYKSTTRKIGLSFILPALDDKDFDSMWEKINKLTTLIYPQYTQGKLYNNPDTGVTFEKPFTQQIGASPMIRLRVGNLFVSNYSKFNLAGIFGLHSEGRALPDPENPQSVINSDDSSPSYEKLVAEVEANNERIRAINPGYTYIATDQNYYTTEAALRSEFDRQVLDVLNNNNKRNKPFNPIRYGDLFQAKVISVGDDGKIEVKFEIASIARSGQSLEESRAAYASFIEDVENGTISDPTKFSYLVNTGDLTPTQETQKKITSAILPDLPDRSSWQASVIDFMREGNNVIAKSFKSAGGKGLAGFIDSMNFDWYNGVTWDTSAGRKAPKMCKVTIAFSPIHDISPGLAADGHNRAPIYPVGVFGYRPVIPPRR